MQKRSIILYWLLILIPTVIIGIVAFRLIYHEQERINRLAVDAISDRAKSISETLLLTVEAVQEELTRSLLSIPDDRLKDTLLEWSETNPLVRNVFIWDEQAGLVYPVSGMASTSEERYFASRFDGLFSGRIQWSSGKPDSSDVNTDSSGTDLVQDISKMNRGKRELISIAQSSRSIGLESSDTMEEGITTGGWVPWFAENRLYILGWVSKGKGRPVYGAELELMTLLSGLINNFPKTSSAEPCYALVDDSGTLLHQSGDMKIDRDIKPLLSVSLEPLLPHWSIAVYTHQDKTTGAGNGLMITALLLLSVFILAIAVGGFLLMKNARQNMIDAQQKTSFVSNVSHELKTPLTSIRMFAELLLDDRVKDQEKKHKYLQIMVAETRRLTRLVNNVLDFSRLEQGQKRYQMEEINGCELIREIIEIHSPRIKEAGMEIILNIPDETIMIRTDRDAMEQVILNLVDNAIKYGADGKVISISLKRDINNVDIRVEDRGPGVPVSQRKKIFEKFHRVDNSLTAKTQGSGLGLSIARRMLRDMGGDLDYEPGAGGGSSFVIRIPEDKVNGRVGIYS